jgi:hypothetical protein
MLSPYDNECRSEYELERELHRARAADIVKRTQDPLRIRERSRGLSKCWRAAETRIDVSKIGMVEDVESLCAKLQLQSFVDLKVPPDRQVHLPCPEPSHEISRPCANAFGLIARPPGHPCPGLRSFKP